MKWLWGCLIRKQIRVKELLGPRMSACAYVFNLWTQIPIEWNRYRLSPQVLFILPTLSLSIPANFHLFCISSKYIFDSAHLNQSSPSTHMINEQWVGKSLWIPMFYTHSQYSTSLPELTPLQLFRQTPFETTKQSQ